MARPTEVVSVCVAAMQAAVQSIAELENKSVHILNEDNLLDRLKGVALPAAGILYEGMRAQPESGAAKTGSHAEIVISVIVVSPSPGTNQLSGMKTNTIEILDKLRTALLTTISPTGHRWRFVVEAAADEKSSHVFWVQRWATTIILQHS